MREHHRGIRNDTSDLVSMSKEAINFWLSKFVVEVRRTDGDLYPPNSIYQICCGLGRSFRLNNRSDVHIFNGSEFVVFRRLPNERT